jgi:hypothetical protein
MTSGKFKIKSVSEIVIRNLRTNEVIMKWDSFDNYSCEEPKLDTLTQETRKWYCAECMEVLTTEEVKWWEDNTPRCCDGYLCGCRGLPVDPPYCNKCMGK